MASVEKRVRDGSTTWLARWRDPDGKQRKRTFPRKVDADRYLTTVEHGMLTGSYIDPAAGKVTFRDYAEQWRAGQVHRPSTVAHVETMLRRHAYPTLGGRPLAGIRPSEVQSWVRRLSEDLQPATVAVVHGLVAAVFKSAVRDRNINGSPCEGVKLPKREPRKVIPPTTEDVQALVQALPERFRALPCWRLVPAFGKAKRSGSRSTGWTSCAGR